MTKPAYVRLTIQEWTAEVCYAHKIDPTCLMCKADMVPGYAIDPKDPWQDCLCSRPRMVVDRGTQKFQDIEMIYVLKCPRCGHSDKIDQDVFTESGPPVGFTTWNQYWTSAISTK